MNELDVINEALNMATLKGCYDMQQVNKISHSFGVVAQRLDDLSKALTVSEKEVERQVKQIVDLETGTKGLKNLIDDKNEQNRDLFNQLEQLRKEPKPKHK
ncbi:hypothetical protein Phi12:1_gp44 [Cellulophaga phage phi12:1]|uniref:Uncharacterized protein n=2 Tax=Cellulophaga phage phi12:1 TaxID=1327976 RepID=R9ZZQ0_9CAUD|nr:hypothetical protein Phi12:1_gp44 [Cellulophaga phage phi12:1]AGO48010.1 hypothetical protein Phi12:1_gp44 [Cellulophaga phage phi12:1]AGO48175.1 hypothetical protein Phi12:3_gp44 [Cellulophaga phage phi12:3]